MRPWEANGGPTDDELRRLVATGHTDKQIGDTYGVARQTVAYWRQRARITRHASDSAPHLSHKEMIPWTVRAVDCEDGIAKRLREYSTIKQGREVSTETRRRVEKFLGVLTDNNLVIDYDYNQGFITRLRDPKVDKPGDIIRRPR